MNSLNVSLQFPSLSKNLTSSKASPSATWWTPLSLKKLSNSRLVIAVRHISPTRTVVVDEPVDPYYPLPPRAIPVDPLYPRALPVPRPLPADPLRMSPTRKPLLRLYEEDELVHSLKE